MPRQPNDLFIGEDFLSLEGRSVKHPALVKYYAIPRANKFADDPVDLLGLDLETESDTGTLRLLGIHDGEHYNHFTSDFLDRLYDIIRMLYGKRASLAWWSQLDPLVLFKQFLDRVENPDDSLIRWGAVAGSWNKKHKRWDIKPVIRVQMADGTYFGITNVIRSSVQFFIEPKDDDLRTVWGYDIKALYESGLEKEAGSRFDWYSKIALEAHIVDWERFETDDEYKAMVLLSNELDAKACRALGIEVQEDFHRAFRKYPKSLISQGSLARSAIASDLFMGYMDIYGDEKTALEDAAEDIKSIGIISHMDHLIKESDEEVTKDLLAMASEAYSGGYIESIRYGSAESAWHADLASAYPATIIKLWDLRGCQIKKGRGEPPEIENAYIFIRGIVDVPKGINFNPITIKHPIYQETNIRAVGRYRATYIKPERDYMERQGVTFANEEWIAVVTQGLLSPLAKVAQKFLDLRAKLKAEGNSAQYMAKIAVNSMYGITYEAVDIYDAITKRVTEKVTTKDDYYKEKIKYYRKKIDLTDVQGDLKFFYDTEYWKIKSMWHKDGGMQPDVVAMELEEDGIYLATEVPSQIVIELDRLYRMPTKNIETFEFDEETVYRAGYRAGEFYNPIFASYITGMTRIRIAEASQAIEDAGGKVILNMTDSIFWTGTKEMLPSDMWKPKKTVGFFEEPDQVTEMVCLGTGRYGFRTEEGYMEAKRRGLNIIDIHNPHGEPIDGIDWTKALQAAFWDGERWVLDVKVRSLISVGMVKASHTWKWRDLGRVVEAERKVELTVGATKRFYDKTMMNPMNLMEGLVPTRSIELDPFMFPEGMYDGTFPQLRGKMMVRHLRTKEERRQELDRENQAKWRERHGEKEKQDKHKETYRQLVDMGFTSAEATRMKKWSAQRINQTINERWNAQS